MATNSGEMGLDDPAVAACRVSPCSCAVFRVISSLYTSNVSLPKEEVCLNIKKAPNDLLVTTNSSEWKPYLTFRSILCTDVLYWITEKALKQWGGP